MLVSKNVSLRPDQYEALAQLGSRKGNQVIREALDLFFDQVLSSHLVNGQAQELVPTQQDESPTAA